MTPTEEEEKEVLKFCEKLCKEIEPAFGTLGKRGKAMKAQGYNVMTINEFLEWIGAEK